MKQKTYIPSDHVVSALANLPQLVFEVTDACNLHCKYCAYGELYDDYDCRENQIFPIAKAIRLIDYLAGYWNSKINTASKRNMIISFYGGEPLLNFSFIKKIVHYVEDEINCPHFHFSYSMTTNAILLDKYMDFLQQHKFHILVSLDGNEANTSYRVDKGGNNAFSKVVANVDKLRAMYPDYFSQYVNFNAVLHNRNSVESIYCFFKDKYDKIPQIGELNDVGIRQNKKDEFKRTYKNTQESLQQAEHYEEIERDMFLNTPGYKSLTLFLHRYSGFVYQDYTDLLFDKQSLKYIPTGTCLPFTKKMYVTVNGKILPCERIGHQFALGRITDTGIDLDPESIASRYNDYYAKMESQCVHCKNRQACIQCIFNLEGIDDKPVCHGYMNESDFKHYVNQQMRFLEQHPEAYQEIMEKVLTL